MMKRRKAREVKIGDIIIGGHEKIAVQSMLSCKAHDIDGNVKQAMELEEAGCDIIRISVPDIETIETVKALKNAVKMPVVADIHFDYKLALASIEAGVNKVRINPGNIGSDEKVKAVVDACKANNLPIRIGVNSGSVQRETLQKYGGPTAEALLESALYHVRLLEKFDFYNTVISMKSTKAKTMVDAYRLAGDTCDYPFHLGVTEAGTERMGVIKSSIGIGSLLIDGIGDTIRVSLTDDPVKEIYAGEDILQAAGLLKNRPELVSCPTCGRTEIDVIGLANAVEKHLKNIQKDITVAVMGCAVNGPGEAREADVGIAGGKGEALLFKKGVPIKKVPEDKIIETLLAEIDKL